MIESTTRQAIRDQQAKTAAVQADVGRPSTDMTSLSRQIESRFRSSSSPRPSHSELPDDLLESAPRDSPGPSVRAPLPSPLPPTPAPTSRFSLAASMVSTSSDRMSEGRQTSPRMRAVSGVSTSVADISLSDVGFLVDAPETDKADADLRARIDADINRIEAHMREEKRQIRALVSGTSLADGPAIPASVERFANPGPSERTGDSGSPGTGYGGSRGETCKQKVVGRSR
jgi:hypothetical protein